MIIWAKRAFAVDPLLPLKEDEFESFKNLQKISEKFEKSICQGGRPILWCHQRRKDSEDYGSLTDRDIVEGNHPNPKWWVAAVGGKGIDDDLSRKVTILLPNDGWHWRGREVDKPWYQGRWKSWRMGDGKRGWEAKDKEDGLSKQSQY